SFDVANEPADVPIGVSSPVITPVVAAPSSMPKFYIHPGSGELTEKQPNANVQPLTLSELVDILRNELVDDELTTSPNSQTTEHVDLYPYEDGDTIVLGPEIFAGHIDDGTFVISWKGENFIPQAPRELNGGMKEPATVSENGANFGDPPNIAPVASERKRVLSLEEQQQMDPNEIRELITAGEAILEQDVAVQ
ncbi:MAG TPA: hypothetical protein VN843_04040, partial [Anaerolineales bacterium]|nr:hypothetical protein [Anaerolineales bacterium]